MDDDVSQVATENISEHATMQVTTQEVEVSYETVLPDLEIIEEKQYVTFHPLEETNVSESTGRNESITVNDPTYLKEMMNFSITEDWRHKNNSGTSWERETLKSANAVPVLRTKGKLWARYR
jgi:hypothetical protein